MRLLLVNLLVVLAVGRGIPAGAQSGSGYALTWSTIDGGGGSTEGGGFRSSGTIGQSDPGEAVGGGYRIRGGFWAVTSSGAAPAGTPTGTMSLVTQTPTSVSGSPTSTPLTPLPTGTPTVGGVTPGTTATKTRTPIAGGTPVPTATASVTPTPKATSTVRPTPVECVGDCNGDGVVGTHELVIGVHIALGRYALAICPAFAIDGSETVTIDELVQAVGDALTRCAPGS